jgi:hypothetical protein
MTSDWLDGFDHVHSGTTVFEPGHPWPIPDSDLTVDLTLDDSALDRKVVALGSLETQVPPVIDAFGARCWREWVRRESFTSTWPAHRSAADLAIVGSAGDVAGT